MPKSKKNDNLRKDGKKVKHKSLVDLMRKIADYQAAYMQFSEKEYESSKPEFKELGDKITFLYEKVKLFIDILNKSFDKEIFDLERADFSEARIKLQRCLDAFDHVDDWCSFNNLLTDLKGKEVLPFVDLLIENNIRPESFVIAYQKNFYYQWIDYIQHLTPVLTHFNRISHDKAAADFGREDRTQFEISKVQIKSKLSSQRPSLDLISAGSAISVLLREGEKKRKQKSIRRLLEETGELVQVIKPCFLMSPLSVSTFLSADAVHFDVVVFVRLHRFFRGMLSEPSIEGSN